MTAPAHPPAVRPAAVDPLRWPDVAARPHSPVRAAVAGRLLRRAARLRGVRVDLPGGRLPVPAPRDAPVLRLHHPEAFLHRIGADGLIGFGESYQAGEWDSPDLVRLLTALAADPAALVPPGTALLRPLVCRRRPAHDLGTADNARQNVHRHYDLSNDLFALFLDPTMTYSSALFPTGPDGAPHAARPDLPAAQHRKIDRLLDLAAVGPGSRVLEIGTGWGELALRAAARGATVVSLTLSREQQVLARHRIAAAGLADRAEVRLCDYREAEGRYDAVVSVEMVEAVGRRFWPDYFRALDRALVPGGRAAVQSITMPHERMTAAADTYTWILKYVFPGGLIPSVRALGEAAAGHSRLLLADSTGFGPHYAETLRLWRERFTDRAAEVADLGFDEVFRRTWEFYLAYSEAGFRSGYLDVRQLLFTRPGEVPPPRREAGADR
ncbi:cyclopropane-fatty-acyl-phospholipid synthase [Streptomyces sp. BE20]|uniref:cyclopropane-fatty-acyl-phospholipid synthase family protein n=1 Tax=Streptomyces sp. BE20 TaxID=3002525 RepID=UPI002E790A52|nr:cyclopropane-fatty-acyl-phospholipid synthase family protein [Streptomyces sp. BE20]MEE1824985.1 cyclopropane-fatty-acyl-phospholipid synthase [Streptomyces sp. BE20]